LLLAQGRLADAERWLARLERFTRESWLSRWLLTVRVLQALADERSGNRSGARARLAAAVQLAAPEGYARAFLDEDSRIVGLLPDVRSAAPAFVAQLLASAGVPLAKPEAAAQPLVEPLSERELEVLALIASGASNRQIADRLVIAPGTVKRHINHIYDKLDVGSRTQAIARAHGLRLL
jgi:LuxR family maltose regulon positive regulatory protein